MPRTLALSRAALQPPQGAHLTPPATVTPRTRSISAGAAFMDEVLVDLVGAVVHGARDGR
jgi:hypothetical protein